MSEQALWDCFLRLQPPGGIMYAMENTWTPTSLQDFYLHNGSPRPNGIHHLGYTERVQLCQEKFLSQFEENGHNQTQTPAWLTLF